VPRLRLLSRLSQISAEDLTEVRTFYATKFGEKLSTEEATELAARVTDLYPVCGFICRVSGVWSYAGLPTRRSILSRV